MLYYKHIPFIQTKIRINPAHLMHIFPKRLIFANYPNIATTYKQNKPFDRLSHIFVLFPVWNPGDLVYGCWHQCIMRMLDFQGYKFQLTVMQKFEVLGKVGQGAYATVYKVKRIQDGALYAMKKIKFLNRTTKEIAGCLNQIRVLASVANPYVLAYKEAFYHEEEGCLVMVTEFASGGDLSAYIKECKKQKERISEQEIWKIAIQLLHGLRALHKLNVFHRDVKSANVLLVGDSKEAKLGDLNVSKVSKSGLACTQTGTPYYSSPQIWGDLPYTDKCDVWSFGCVLYQMAALRPPFLATDLPSLRKRIEEGHFQRIPTNYSPDLEAIIRLCLTPSAKERPSAEGLLHHSLIRKHLYLFPNQKFNQSTFDLSDKQNRLLQTIRPLKNGSIGSSLNLKLPKSNYECNMISSTVVITSRNGSVSKIRNQLSERLPQIMRRNSSRESIMREKPPQPRGRLLYLR